MDTYHGEIYELLYYFLQLRSFRAFYLFEIFDLCANSNISNFSINKIVMLD